MEWLSIRQTLLFTCTWAQLAGWPSSPFYWLFLRATNATHWPGCAHFVFNLFETNEICVSCRWAINQSQNSQRVEQANTRRSRNWLGNKASVSVGQRKQKPKLVSPPIAMGPALTHSPSYYTSKYFSWDFFCSDNCRLHYIGFYYTAQEGV